MISKVFAYVPAGPVLAFTSTSRESITLASADLAANLIIVIDLNYLLRYLSRPYRHLVEVEVPEHAGDIDEITDVESSAQKL